MAIFELEQSYETPVTQFCRGPFKIRCAYARSRDCQEIGERGQDYLAWRAESYRAVFALCDGVGQSFFGGIGAQLIGEVIIDWLWKIDTENKNNTSIQLAQGLYNLLDAQKFSATKLIDEKDIKTVDSEIIRDALDSRRKRKGTQTNFVCGLIDPPNQYFPEGRILLFWLGDAKLQIWLGTTNNSAKLNAVWSSKEGWSSKFGIAGEIHHFQGSLQDLNCIIAHSDGLDPLSSKLAPGLASGEIDKGINGLRDLPSSDDVSFLEISLAQSVVEMEDDIVSYQRTILMRDSTELPVKIVKIIEKVPFEKEVIKFIKEKEIVEKKVVPLWMSIITALLLFTVLLSFPLGYYIGHKSIPASQPISTYKPTLTLLPTVTSTTHSTLVPLISGYLPTEEIAIFSNDSLIPLYLGCNNLATMVLGSDSNSQIMVRGFYQVKAYSNESCHGNPVVTFNMGANQPIDNNILSISVEAMPYP